MSSPPLINGRIPPYNNPPIQPQYFQPSVFFISSITLGQNTTITTTENMNYVLGQLCRLLIPFGYGTRELNEQTGYVVNIPEDNQAILNIYSINATPFINAMLANKAQIIAVGDVNSGIISQTGRVLNSTNIPGSFINISP